MRATLLGTLLLLAVCAAAWPEGAGEQMHTAQCCLGNGMCCHHHHVGHKDNKDDIIHAFLAER